jgi:hypothetical protein
LKTNIEEFAAQIRRGRDQMPFAIARALTDAAQEARDRINAEMPKVFDRPVPFTQRAVGIRPATKNHLTASVFVYDKQSGYLLLEETGGIRTPGMAGRPGRAIAIAAKGQRRDRFGGLPAGTAKRLQQKWLQLQAARRQAEEARAGAPAGQRRGVGPAERGVVYIRGSARQAHGKPGGFFVLKDKKLARLITFAGEAHYQPRFNFRARVLARAAEVFRKQFPIRFAEALKSRR